MVKKKIMTVQEAGRKGGRSTATKYGPKFYEVIGQKGGKKVRDLINKGKKVA